MKANYIFLIIASTILISCGEDRRKEYVGLTLTDRWIEEQMRENYYWYEDMPASGELNYFLPADQFFTKLLSKQDGKTGAPYSYIENLSETNNTRSTIETTYGIEFDYISNPAKTTERFVRVLYTIKNSPAEAVNIKRGDWIFTIDGNPITSTNIGDLITGKKSMRLQVGTLNEDKLPTDTRIVTIGPAQSITNNPIYYYNTYERDNKKIGYLVYNSFVSGEGNDTRYNDQLKEISNEFKAENVEEFILDLRYNLGGELDRPVPLLCTMLTPAETIGKPMGFVKYNDKNQEKNWQLDFSEEHLNGGSHLDLNPTRRRVFILTSGNTASASEAVMSFLEPYIKVVQVGTKTVGKNVGSEEIKHDTIRWALHPIVAKIYNSLDESKDEGFTSEDYGNITESTIFNLLPIGDPEEKLLKTALSLIDDTYVGEETTRNYIDIKTTGSSLDRKSLPGALLLKR